MFAPVAGGLLVHFLYKQYETSPANTFLSLALLIGTPFFSSTLLLYHSSLSLAVALPLGFLLFYATLTISIITYRISPWHPLAKYPGPLLAKVSQLYLAYLTKKGSFHIILKEWHDHYGPYIRIGPNQLSFVDASMIPSVMGPDGMPKGPIFNGSRLPGVPHSVVTSRNPTEHKQFRKPWSQGLSAASIREYKPILCRRSLQLVETISREANSDSEMRVDITKWMSFFAADFMGDMAFGGGFELMRDGDVNGIWTIINDNMATQSALQRIPWCTQVVSRLPFVVAAMVKLNKFVLDCVNLRLSRGVGYCKDLFYHLAHEDEPGYVIKLPSLCEDAKIAIVAGSDTTASTLTNIIFYLVTNSEIYSRLRAELDKSFPPEEGDPFDFSRLAELPYLNSVINEALRLYPPVPTDLQRSPLAGTKAKQIGEHTILEDTSVLLPPYVIHRQERYFSYPDKFIPERWLQPAHDKMASNKKLGRTIFKHDQSAFFPFSFGPAICAGKLLALQEIRVVIALLLQRFDLHPSKSYDYSKWEGNTCSFFVLKLDSLPIVISPRN